MSADSPCRSTHCGTAALWKRADAEQKKQNFNTNIYCSMIKALRPESARCSWWLRMQFWGWLQNTTVGICGFTFLIFFLSQLCAIITLQSFVQKWKKKQIKKSIFNSWPCWELLYHQLCVCLFSLVFSSCNWTEVFWCKTLMRGSW